MITDEHSGYPLCGHCLKPITKPEGMLKPRFIPSEHGFAVVLYCEKCRKIIDERSEKIENDVR